MSNSLRITGMATGMDTEATVKQMMKPYTTRVDKMKQDRQIVAWRQELYRDMLTDTAAIKNTYFDVLKPATNMLSKNSYAGFDVTAANSDPTKSAGVSATASVGAVVGNYKVEVTNLATAAKVDGTSINESNKFDIANIAKWQSKTITFEIGGEKQTITIGAAADKEALIVDINNQIDNNTSLKGKINVTDGDGIKFNALTSDSVRVFSTTVDTDMDNLKGKVINNPNKYTTKLSDLGIVNGGTLTFKYNDPNGIQKTSIDIPVLETATISQLIDAVNQGTSGAVKLNFSELTGAFSIESLQTGSSASLNVTENGGKGVLRKLNFTTSNPLDGSIVPPSGKTLIGTDATVKITPPGTSAAEITVTKPGNAFSIDGVNYTLTKEGTTNITVTGNSQKTYDKIKGFIDKYNELVDNISQKTDEKKQYKYLPLTEEQRTAMKEDEIKQWETKAKVGLLKGDSNLENMLNSMRSAFYEGVEGAGISLSEIGLSTSSDITKKGKIIIDETKLKAAIETRGEQVASLFTKQSITPYSADNTSTQRSDRNKDEGIFQRINDILQDYTRTSRNNNGKKGILLEKAGIKGDSTEFKSLLSEDIIKKDAKINEMIKSLSTRENKYYLQFSKLEVAMNKLNSQSSWLTQQLGGGQ
jgi:flagellar hook-associated protein 2